MQIYKTINLINNKIYIGKDSHNNPNYYGSGKIIKYAIKRYGKQNFKKEILCECKNIDDLNRKEQYWIKKLNNRIPNGYNLTDGGEGSLNLDKDVCNKIASHFIGKTWEDRFGKEKSDKMKENAKKRRFGKTWNDIWGDSIATQMKNNHSIIAKNNSNWGMKNKRFTQESKKKIGDWSRGKTYEELFGEENSEKIKKRKSKSMKGNKNAKGCVRSDEYKEKHRGIHKYLNSLFHIPLTY